MPPLTFVQLGIELAPTSDMHEVAAFSHAALSALPGFAAETWWFSKRGVPGGRGVGTPSLAVLDDANAVHGWIAMAKNGSVGLTSYAHARKTNRAARPDKVDGWSLGFVLKELDGLATEARRTVLRSLCDIAKGAATKLDIVKFSVDSHPNPTPGITTLEDVEAQFRAWLG